jgi:hypothetical protein
MGLFFAPLLSLVTFIKFFIVFFLRIFYVNYCCVPATSFYQVLGLEVSSPVDSLVSTGERICG